MAEPPLEATCDDCQQTRPVFLYEPNCNWPPCTIPGCPCCSPNKPLVCIRCEDKRRKEEASV